MFGFYAFHGLPAPGYAYRAAKVYRYAAPVFFSPPWAAIYHSDAERGETYEEAAEVFEHTLGAYVSLGYDPVILPLGTVAERARFVLDVLDDYADPQAK
jgi:predicted ATPase